MANTNIPMQVQTANFMMPSEALGRAYALKNQKMQSDMAAAEMRDNALMDQAYRAAGGDISKMQADPNMGFRGGMEIAKLRASQAQAQADAQKAEQEQKIQRLETGSQILGSATDQASWDSALSQFKDIFGEQAAANFPAQYDPAIQNNILQQGIAMKDKIAMQRDEMRYAQQDARDAARFANQMALIDRRLAAQGGGDGGGDKAPKIVTINGQSYEQLPDGTYRQPTVGGAPVPPKPAKPMPASAVKLEGEYISDLSTAKNLENDVTKYLEDIDKGRLDFGSAKNIKGAVSVKYGDLPLIPDATAKDIKRESFISDMKRLRNQSLALNKGVQTDQDAQREWEALFANLNNADYVKERLVKIADINRRGASLKQLQIDTQREQFGADPYDYSNVNGGNAPAQPPSSNNARGTIVRTGNINGRKVVQYSDGTTEYAD